MYRYPGSYNGVIGEIGSTPLCESYEFDRSNSGVAGVENVCWACRSKGVKEWGGMFSLLRSETRRPDASRACRLADMAFQLLRA